MFLIKSLFSLQVGLTSPRFALQFGAYVITQVAKASRNYFQLHFIFFHYGRTMMKLVHYDNNSDSNKMCEDQIESRLKAIWFDVPVWMLTGVESPRLLDWRSNADHLLWDHAH